MNTGSMTEAEKAQMRQYEAAIEEAQAAGTRCSLRQRGIAADLELSQEVLTKLVASKNRPNLTEEDRSAREAEIETLKARIVKFEDELAQVVPELELTKQAEATANQALKDYLDGVEDARKKKNEQAKKVRAKRSPAAVAMDKCKERAGTAGKKLPGILAHGIFKKQTTGDEIEQRPNTESTTILKEFMYNIVGTTETEEDYAKNIVIWVFKSALEAGIDIQDVAGFDQELARMNMSLHHVKGLLSANKKGYGQSKRIQKLINAYLMKPRKEPLTRDKRDAIQPFINEMFYANPGGAVQSVQELKACAGVLSIAAKDAKRKRAELSESESDSEEEDAKRKRGDSDSEDVSDDSEDDLPTPHASSDEE